MSAPSTFIVIPVRNRLATTLRCLENLDATGVLKWAQPVVVDDASTDGTDQAVAERFPQATILKGDGNLWWTGGIEKGMRHAMAEGAEFITWLNDDCLPEPGTLEGLVEVAQERHAIAVAQSRTPTGYVYGGYRQEGLGIASVACGRDEMIRCEASSGNCVLIPRWAVDQIGYPDARNLPHHRGDIDYGLRARDAGIAQWVVGRRLCLNDDNWNKHMKSWLLSEVPMRQLWREVLSMRSTFHPRTAWVFSIRHFGWTKGLVAFGLPYLRLCLICACRLLAPTRLLRRVYGKHSAGWQAELRSKQSPPA